MISKYQESSDIDSIILYVHLTFYDDATGIAINIAHCVADQLGIASFIHAWLDLLRGAVPQPFLQIPPSTLDGKFKNEKEDLRMKNRFRICFVTHSRFDTIS